MRKIITIILDIILFADVLINIFTGNGGAADYLFLVGGLLIVIPAEILLWRRGKL